MKYTLGGLVRRREPAIESLTSLTVDELLTSQEGYRKTGRPTVMPLEAIRGIGRVGDSRLRVDS